jgi:dihydrofolate reductase
MRNVTFSMNISIDGCCDHTFARPDEEIYEYFTDYLKRADVVVYGRNSYELMFPYWSEIAMAQSETDLENEFALILTAMNKVVFSHTLDSAEHNTRIIRDNLEDEILKLKRQSGKNISVGGVNLHAQVAALGLIDEYFLVVHPVIVGEGKKLFEGVQFPGKTAFKLADSKVFKSGCIGLHYVKQ